MLLLKMEMPDNCQTCPFCDFGLGICLADGLKTEDGVFTYGRKASENEEKRADWCPIKGEAKKVRHGEWIEEEHKTVSDRGRVFNSVLLTCSFCEKPNGRHRTDYCPHCGARMDGKKVKAK